MAKEKKGVTVTMRLAESEYEVAQAITRLIAIQHEGLEVGFAQLMRKVLNESKNRYKENFKQWEDVYNNASDEDKAVLGALLK